jgi:hypothetical protein
LAFQSVNDGSTILCSGFKFFETLHSSGWRDVPLMKNYHVIILPGDGIGPEIVEETLNILDVLQKLSGSFNYRNFVPPP